MMEHKQAYLGTQHRLYNHHPKVSSQLGVSGPDTRSGLLKP